MKIVLLMFTLSLTSLTFANDQSKLSKIQRKLDVLSSLEFSLSGDEGCEKIAVVKGDYFNHPSSLDFNIEIGNSKRMLISTGQVSEYWEQNYNDIVVNDNELKFTLKGSSQIAGGGLIGYGSRVNMKFDKGNEITSLSISNYESDLYGTILFFLSGLEGALRTTTIKCHK